MASKRMMGASHHDSHITKAACHCGRRMCSEARKELRRRQRRIEKTQWKKEESSNG